MLAPEVSEAVETRRAAVRECYLYVASAPRPLGILTGRLPNRPHRDRSRARAITTTGRTRTSR